VVVTGHDDRCLQVAQGEDVVPGVAVGGDVDCLVGDALLVYLLTFERPSVPWAARLGLSDP
jgi:hypothetical protein